MMNRFGIRLGATGAMALLLVCSFGAPAAAQFESITPILVEGDPAPDGDGVFAGPSFFSPPTINANGDVAFLGSFINTAHPARVVVSTPEGLEQRVRSGDSAPGGSGTIRSLWGGPVAVNAAGQVAITVNLDGVPSDRDRAIVLGGQSLIEVVREGDDPGDGNGELVPSGIWGPGIDDNGFVSFRAGVRNTTPSGSANAAVYRGNGGPLQKIMREGDPVPGEPGVTFASIDGVLASSAAGGVAINVDLAGTPGGENDDEALFVSDPSLRRRLTKGDPSPDGDGTALPSFEPRLANDGVLGVEMRIVPAVGGESEFSVAAYPDVGPGLLLSREGVAAPEDGFFRRQTVEETLAIADGSTIAFATGLTGTTGGPGVDDVGVFLSTGSALVEVARRGESTPDGDGEFDDFDDRRLHVNAEGDIVVLATVRANTVLGEGIFLFRDGGATRSTVIRVGQPLLGSTVAFLDLLESKDARQAGLAAISDGGKVAFEVTLADGRGAVMVTVPEPATTLPYGCALLGILFHRRRSRRR